MTSNLGALLSTVETLMQKNSADLTWSQDARGFKEALADRASARSLDDLLRHPFFRLMNGEGGLIPPVYLVNKTAYHELKLLRGTSFRKTETDDEPMALPAQCMGVTNPDSGLVVALGIQYDVGLYAPWEEIAGLVSNMSNEVAFYYITGSGQRRPSYRM
ncbi:hypothetical protein IFM51744_10455 [Aspergillus udagawae]|nr:hypothetical protein IFM51744_10455 [Aspergillus udagawae]GFG19698.1 hypothetical protein IFM5058_10270 [Aspergillus udagawae]